MKVAFSTDGIGMDASLDQRFGRCQKFIIVDTESLAFTIVDNAQNLNASQGAGIQSAQNVIATGAQALVTGHCGPKAFKVLHAADIPIYLGVESTIKNNIEDFRNGKLAQLTSPDVEGHW